LLTPLRQADPGAWSWTPTADQISRLPAAELQRLKARADAQAAPTF
jgi:hypothetical protein